MSLINQMLQDLDTRRASERERSALPSYVRALPEGEKTPLSWWLYGVGAVMGLAVIAWQVHGRYAASPENSSTTSQAPTTVPASASVKTPDASVAAVTPPSASPAARMSLDLEHLPQSVNSLSSSTKNLRDQIADNKSKKTLPLQMASVGSNVDANRTTVQKTAVMTQSTTSANSPSTNRTAANTATIEPPRTTTQTNSSVFAPLPFNPSAITLPVVTNEASKPATTAATTSSAGAATKAVTNAPSGPSSVSIKPSGRAADAVTENVVPADARIDKRSQPLNAQQLAENEYRAAVTALNQGQLAEAQEGFRHTLEHAPSHVGARQALLGLLLEQKKSAEAEQLLQQGLTLNPNQPGFALALARLEVEHGDAAGAITTLQKTAPSAQNSPDYLGFLAALLQRQSRHQEAVTYYQSTLRLAPGSGVWLMGMGISLQALNRNAEAQDAFRRAKATNTLNADLLAFVDQRLKQLQ